MTETLDILWFSEQLNFDTGYGNVSKELCSRWAKKGHNVNAVGWYFLGAPTPVMMKNDEGEWENTGIMQHAGEHSIGCHKKFDGNHTVAWAHMRNLKPDLVASLVDIWFTGTLVRETTALQIPYLSYFPLDGEPFPPLWIKLMYESKVLAMSKWGKAKMEEVLFNVFEECRDIDQVYHGVNLKNFYPLKENWTDERTVREELIRLKGLMSSAPKSIVPQLRDDILKLAKADPDRIVQGEMSIEDIKQEQGWEDKFIVGFVGKHMVRKMIPRLVRAFQQFHKLRPKSVLVLNIGNVRTSDYGADIEHYISNLGISDSVYFFGNTMSHNIGVPVDKLNRFYNLMDVHASMTSGEGFGLTTAESMATGTPNIIVDYTTAEELVGGRGWLVEPCAYVEGQFGVNRAVGDIEKFVNALVEAHDNEDLRKKNGEKAMKWTRKNLDWDDIADKFLKIIKKNIDNYTPPQYPSSLTAKKLAAMSSLQSGMG